MKLPNGFGTVYKLSGKNRRNPYVAKKTSGWENDPETGRSKQLYTVVGYYPTRKEALAALAAYNSDPNDLHHSTITYEELYEKWSEEHFKKIKKTNGYKAAFNTSEKLWKMKFVEIKLDHLQSVVDESGKNAPTLKTLKNMWGLMYSYAVKHEIVSQDKRDMVRYVDISNAGNPNAYDRKPFTKNEVELLWKCKDSNIYVTVILIMIYSGVRIGELLSLEKKDVHLDERWFYVEESKTESGIREVPIAEKIVPFFEYWLNRNCDHLFCDPNDRPFPYRKYYDSYWIPLMLELGFGKYVVDEEKKEPVYDGHRPHDTRHTCVSLLVEKKVDERIIKKIVGHKGQGVTETVYTHIELPIKLEAINSI
jgi:integrase